MAKFHPSQLNGEFLTKQLNGFFKLTKAKGEYPKWRCKKCGSDERGYTPMGYEDICPACYELHRRYAGNAELVELASLRRKLNKGIRDGN